MIRIVCDRCGAEMAVEKSKFPFMFSLPAGSYSCGGFGNGDGEGPEGSDKIDVWVNEPDRSMRRLDLCPSCSAGMRDYIFCKVDLKYIQDSGRPNSQL